MQLAVWIQVLAVNGAFLSQLFVHVLIGLRGGPEATPCISNCLLLC